MKKALVILFVAFIGGFLLLNIALPDKTFSDMENRNLAGKPALSLESVLSGQFESDAESYVTDQFALRDHWIALKAYAERLLGKRENNGVYICSDTLIERIDEPDADRLAANLSAVNRFAENSAVPVYFTLIPSAAEIWRDKLPAGAPRCDERALIERLAAETKAVSIDTLSALSAHSDEALYYRTDHHWTSLGALYGAQALLDGMGIETCAADSAPVRVTDAFYGTLYSRSGARYIQPDGIDVYVPSGKITVTHIEGEKEIVTDLYDEEKLAVKDKYAFFMGGNQPLAVVRTGNEGKKLLLIRDSYADCEIPFLCGAFSEIHALDLRYYRDSLSAYIEDNGIDCVAISYSLRSFVGDTNLFFLNR